MRAPSRDGYRPCRPRGPPRRGCRTPRRPCGRETPCRWGKPTTELAQVGIGRPPGGDQPADPGQQPPGNRRVQLPSGGHGDRGSRTTSLPPAEHPGDSPRAASRSATLRRPKATVAPGNGGRGRECQGVGGESGRPGPPRSARTWPGQREHRHAEIGRRDPRPRRRRAAAWSPVPQQRSSTGDARREPQERRRPPPPDQVQAGGQQVVQQVVAGATPANMSRMVFPDLSSGAAEVVVFRTSRRKCIPGQE